YKATRQRMPDDLRPQIQTTKEILEALGIPIFEVDGYEADDVLGTMARSAAAEGFDVLIVTGDLDVLQLIDTNIKIMVTSRGITETTVYDREKFQSRFGFDPARLPDYKGLKGDTTDNIPGVPGIGDKTAGQLIQEFGTVEDLLQHLDRVPAKFQDPLRARSEQILQSKHLATIVTDAPVHWEWEKLRRRPPDRERLQALFAELEFKSLLERVGVAGTQPEGQYRRAADAAELASAARGAEEIGLYLARGAGHPLTARLTGIAVCAVPGRALYLPIADDRVPEALRPLVEGPAVKVSGDVKGDLLILWRCGLQPRGFDVDVAIASYLMNPGRRTHTLGTAAWEYLGWRLRMDEEPEAQQGLGLSRDEVAEACEAADVLRRLRPVLVDRMRDKQVLELFTEIETPLVAVLAAMEEAGVAVDVPYLRALAEEMDRRLAELTAEIYRLAGTEFNISSPKQLGFVLFEKLRLPPVKKTKTGYSTDAEVLESLAPHHEIVANIVAHRELTKLKTTYVDVLPALVNARTGRVHTTFNQTVAATGRVITTDPN
ncbi:MAG TPA: DNA polymerase, partial [bacterium]|nr:DNA polymerase [bacterium]